MVSIKRNSRITDFLRDTPPKLLQTAPVLPTVNFSVKGQFKPFFSHETILKQGTLSSPTSAEVVLEVLLPPPRGKGGKFPPPPFLKIAPSSSKLFQGPSFSRSQKNPDSQEKEML